MLLKTLKFIFVFLILTLFTQIGGLIYLISHLFYYLLKLNKLEGLKENLRRIGFHVVFYLICTVIVIPPLAALFGRVPLPYFSENNLGPRTIWTTLLNRHYVKPRLKEIALEHSAKMAEKYPVIRVNYFDANFPFSLPLPFKFSKFMNFKNGFPLFPHLSHNDGKKLDIGFVYDNSETGELSKETPSAIGYGISEEPLKGEYDEPLNCRKKGNWQYNFMHDYYPQGGKENYKFNSRATAELIGLFKKDPRIAIIFLEPHLESRLRLTSSKISQAGSHAVRHDDHFHVQIQ